MNSNPGLFDHIIGEAALTILSQKLPVSLGQILRELYAMAGSTADSCLKESCLGAISSLEEACSASSLVSGRPSRDGNFMH